MDYLIPFISLFILSVFAGYLIKRYFLSGCGGDCDACPAKSCKFTSLESSPKVGVENSNVMD